MQIYISGHKYYQTMNNSCTFLKPVLEKNVLQIKTNLIYLYHLKHNWNIIYSLNILQ